MKERSILFSAPMVRALLDGSKTQTRRVVKISHRTPGLAACLTPPVGDPRPRVAAQLCPYGVPGDRLWVRETFVQGFPYEAVTDRLLEHDDEGNPAPKRTWYRATDPDIKWSGDDGWEENVPWKPSIHMPRSASRITLEITGVRVQRLQDITRGDAMSEGCPFPNMAKGDDPRLWFATLWDRINGAGAWGANPWVWALELRKVAP